MQSSPVAVKTPALQYMRAILAWQTCPACHLQSTPWLQDAKPLFSAYMPPDL